MSPPSLGGIVLVHVQQRLQRVDGFVDRRVGAWPRTDPVRRGSTAACVTSVTQRATQR